jgi:hypothetical protein
LPATQAHYEVTGFLRVEIEVPEKRSIRQLDNYAGPLGHGLHLIQKRQVEFADQPFRSGRKFSPRQKEQRQHGGAGQQI